MDLEAEPIEQFKVKGYFRFQIVQPFVWVDELLQLYSVCVAFNDALTTCHKTGFLLYNRPVFG